MTPSENVARIQNVLKRLMKEQGLIYEDAASHLGVSLVTVKRLLNRDDISIAQLTELSEWLGLEFPELIKAAFSEKPTSGHVTAEQEEFLALNPNYCAFLGALMEGLSPKAIAKKYKLNKDSVERYLLGLDKQNLIAYLGNGRVKVLVGRFLSVRDLPKLRQVFYEHFLDVAYPHFRSAVTEMGDAHLKMTMMRLSRRNYDQLKMELDAVYEKFLVATKYDTKIEPPENLKDATLIMLADLWKHPSFNDVISNF